MTIPASAHLHTPFYCEENVYHLVQTLVKEYPDKDVYAIFISNLQRQNLLFYQKASGDKQYVIWDYHVIAAVFPRRSDNELDLKEGQSYDLDSVLGLKVPWAEYVEDTFRPDMYKARGLAETLLEMEPPRFRFVPAQDLLAHFASDRSHMLDPAFPEESRYYATPPIWPLICSPEAQKQGVRHNLWTRYLDMRMETESQGIEEVEQARGSCGSLYTLVDICLSLKPAPRMQRPSPSV